MVWESLVQLPYQFPFAIIVHFGTNSTDVEYGTLSHSPSSELHYNNYCDNSD